MSGPQFFRVQSFSRKMNPVGQSVEQVLAEAARSPAFSAHVNAPRPPRVIVGLSPEEVMRRHNLLVDEGCIEVRMSDGTVKRRGIRKDRHTLLTCVASHPHLAQQVSSDPSAKQAYEEWVERNIRFFRDLFCDRLVSVIEHIDEAHPHLHAFVLPLDDPTCAARDLNPAWVAKSLAEDTARAAGHDAQSAVKLGNAAYRARARELQDQYFAAVSVPCGLTRTGPKRERLSRAQWRARKEEARRQAELLRQMEEKVASLSDAEEDLGAAVEAKAAALAERMEEIETNLADAIAERAIAKEMMDAAEADARAMLEAARRNAEEIDRAARVQADGLQRRAFEEIEAARSKLLAGHDRLAHERAMFDAERAKRMTDAVAAAAALTAQLLVGVVRGTVTLNEKGSGWVIQDRDLRDRVERNAIGFAVKEVVMAFAKLWSQLRDRLSDRDLDLQKAAAEAVLGPVAAPPKARPTDQGPST
jgi:hypothetical protein